MSTSIIIFHQFLMSTGESNYLLVRTDTACSIVKMTNQYLSIIISNPNLGLYEQFQKKEVKVFVFYITRRMENMIMIVLVNNYNHCAY